MWSHEPVSFPLPFYILLFLLLINTHNCFACNPVTCQYKLSDFRLQTCKGEVRSAAAESTSPYLFSPLPAIGWTGTKIHSAVPPYLKSSISSYLSRFHENFRSIVHNAGRALYFHTELQGRFICTYGDTSHRWYPLWATAADYWSSSLSFTYKYVFTKIILWQEMAFVKIFCLIMSSSK